MLAWIVLTRPVEANQRAKLAHSGYNEQENDQEK